MKSTLYEYIVKIQEKHRRYRRYIGVLVILAFVTILGVNRWLRQDGISMTADYQCGLQEHIHTDECYEQICVCEKEELNNVSKEEITTESHMHNDTCYEKQLICKSIEHRHTTECVSDNVADMETISDWEKTLPSELSGVWKDDLIAIAKSQIGYEESQANYIVSDEGEQCGYTRYGEWYGNRYGKWDTLFVSFCLHYAMVSEECFPVNSGCEAWINDLEKKELYKALDIYRPEVGDLVFFDNEKQDGKADHVAIIENVIETDNGLSLKVIEAISGGVQENTYSVNESLIVGYAVIKQPQVSSEETYVQIGTETELKENCEQTGVDKEITEVFEQTVETENYSVTITYDSDAKISKNTEFRVVEFDNESDEYKKVCEEAGEMFDWVLDIAFYEDEQEIEPQSPVIVSVTMKETLIDEKSALKITHFADSGTEVVNTDEIEIKEETDGQSEITFELSSLSLVAGQSYHPATVTTYSDFTGDNEYLIYKVSGNYIYFLASLNNEPVTFKVALSEVAQNTDVTSESATEIGSTLYFKNSITGVVVPATGNSYNAVLSWSNVVWKNGWGAISNSTGTENYNYLKIRNNDLTMTWWQTITAVKGSQEKYTRLYETGVLSKYYLAFVNGKFTGTMYAEYGDLTIAKLGNDYIAPNPDSGTNNSEAAVYTGKITSLPLGFYSVCLKGSNNQLSGLAGVTYTIYNNNGNVVGSITTADDMYVDISSLNLASGSYTMQMTNVPNGYVCDTESWKFDISSDSKKLSLKTSEGKMTGILLVNSESDLQMDKTASVKNYEDRVYQVDLNAHSNLKTLEMENLSINFVVDQSNSMLFPAGLKETSGQVIVKGSDKSFKGTVSGLDKNQVYYIITDASSTSTVFAIFYKNGTWWYQDAAYYAKAYYRGRQDMIKTSDTIYFPHEKKVTNYDQDTHGGKLDNSSNLYGSTLVYGVNGTMRYKVYKASDNYNRLHYLEQSLNDMLQMLAEINPNARVTLDLFTSQWNSHITVVLGENNGLETLLNAVGNITTDGGTRQDLALQHVYENHLNTNYKNRYLVLITDGAPVGGTNVGTATDTANANGTIYERINYWAKQIKNRGITLATVGLSMQDVESGSKSMRYIATGGPSTSATVSGDYGEWWFQPSNSANLVPILCNSILSQIANVKTLSYKNEVVIDYISDSFYPVNPKTNQAVQSGTRINKDGTIVTWGSGSGTILQDEKGGWYVQWDGVDISSSVWSGRVYIKAKEDFIGGNAILTNKSAKLLLQDGGEYEYAKPTVNVHLLEMNKLQSEVTVYKGDIINENGNTPEDSLQYFFNHVEIQKLFSGKGDVLNKVGATDEMGCYSDAFTIPYALGRKTTSDEWEKLKKGEEIAIPYTYNNADGEVGEFRLKLEKSAVGEQRADYGEHEAMIALGTEEAIETYTLTIQYTAYRLGGNNRPTENVYNGTAGPGIEVGSVESTDVSKGAGVVESTSVHQVYAIDGTIRVWKEIDESLKSSQDQEYVFTLYRNLEKVDEQTIIVPANQLKSAQYIEFKNLSRGMYTIVENVSDDYIVEKMQISENTNCYSEGNESTKVTFVLGNDTNNKNVIGKENDSMYSSYIGTPNGILGEVVITNKKQTYSTDISVKKVWNDESENYKNHTVYVALFKNDTLVTSTDETGVSVAQVLKLDQENQWRGSFQIPLMNKNDKESPKQYSVRELKKVEIKPDERYQKAILVNDNSVIYFKMENLLENGDLTNFGEITYQVSYDKELNTEKNVLVVKNAVAYELPNAGGIGRLPFIMSGLLLIAGSLLCGYGKRHRWERGNR